jgi:predicted dienelactone hydrolase
MRISSQLFLSLMLVVSNCSFAQSRAVPIHLPSPSGTYGVGRIGYDWVDQSRAEAFSKRPDARREIVVYIWYPTQLRLKTSACADYLPHGDSIAKFEKTLSYNEVETTWGSSWYRIFTHQIITDTYDRVPILNGTERFPVLIFAPGYSVPSTMYTTLIERLVSHGYVVASIEPTYDVADVAFPDGRVIHFLPDPADPGRQPSLAGENWNDFLARLRKFGARHVRQWAGDIGFVLNRLAVLNGDSSAAASFANRLDLRHVGVLGHSMGGMAAIRGCQLDTRIAACLNADGGGPDGPFPPFQDSRLLHQPVMWIEILHPPATTAQFAVHKITRKVWERDRDRRHRATEERLQKSPGGAHHLTLSEPTLNHQSFGDYPLVESNSKEEFDRAQHTLATLELYIAAFFDSYLKH